MPCVGTSAFLSCIVLPLASYKRHLTTDPDFKSSSFVLVTSTSIIGCGAIFKLMMDFPKFKIWKSCQITINPVHTKEKKLKIKIYKDMKIKVYENQ